MFVRYTLQMNLKELRSLFIDTHIKHKIQCIGNVHNSTSVCCNDTPMKGELHFGMGIGLHAEFKPQVCSHS